MMRYMVLLVLLQCLVMGLTQAAQSYNQSNFSRCVGEVREFNTRCQIFVKSNGQNVCEAQSKAMMLKCQNTRIIEECQKCFTNLEVLVEECVQFYRPSSKTVNMSAECITLKKNLAESCSMKCPVCKDKLCKNGGKCEGADYIFSCRCPDHARGVHCETSRCSHPCKNKGICAGNDLCRCLYPYTGLVCGRLRLGSKQNPAKSANEILQAGDSLGNDMYWIQPPGETKPAHTYCDMTFDDGGWMLASYGYVEVDGDDHRNKLMLNMNYPNGFLWLPQQRSFSHGVITLSKGATLLARSATYMIMAAGNNPNTGGINKYQYVYKINLCNITGEITFNNHNPYHGASGARNIPRMRLQAFAVHGLKGDVRNYTRFSLAESLGVTSRDSFPTGYGFYDRKEQYAYFHRGPFFPSVHSGSGRIDSFRFGKCRSFSPDVEKTCYRFNYKGWYTATSMNNYGQMSIWFK